jgi:hypothetical protein
MYFNTASAITNSATTSGEYTIMVMTWDASPYPMWTTRFILFNYIYWNAATSTFAGLMDTLIIGARKSVTQLDSATSKVGIGDNAIGSGELATTGVSEILHYKIDTVTIGDSSLAAFTYMALKPTTTGRKLDVSTTGEAGLDWANVGGQATTVALSATTVGVTTAVTNSVSLASGGITASTIATGAIDADAIDVTAAREIADSVWESLTSNHGGVGSYGALLETQLDSATSKVGIGNNAIGSGELASTAALEVSDTVWDEILTGATHNVTNSAGRKLRSLAEYQDAAVWIDTINGSAGTTSYSNGTYILPVSTLADARTLALALPLFRFRIANGSSITLANGYTNYDFIGDRWLLSLGGQAITGCYVSGATVSGTATGTNPAFDNCLLGAVTLPPSTINHTGLAGTLTVGSAGVYYMDACYAAVSPSQPVIDFGAAVGATTVHLRHYAGEIDLQNVKTGDILTFGGTGAVNIGASCTGGTVRMRGNIKLVDSSGGAVAIDDTARYAQDQTIWPLEDSIGTVLDTLREYDAAGHLSVAVASVSANAIDNASIASGAIDSTKIATDAIGQDELKDNGLREMATHILADTTTRLYFIAGGVDADSVIIPASAGGEVWTTAQRDTVLNRTLVTKDSVYATLDTLQNGSSTLRGSGSSNWTDAQRDSVLNRTLVTKDSVYAILDTLQNVSSALRVDTNTIWTTAQRDTVLNRTLVTKDSTYAVLDTLQNVSSSLRVDTNTVWTAANRDTLLNRSLVTKDSVYATLDTIQNGSSTLRGGAGGLSAGDYTDIADTVKAVIFADTSKKIGFKGTAGDSVKVVGNIVVAVDSASIARSVWDDDITVQANRTVTATMTFDTTLLDKVRDTANAIIDTLQNLSSTLRLAGSDLDTVYQTVVCNDTLSGDFLLSMQDYRNQIKNKLGIANSNTTWMTDTVLNQLVREAIVTVNPIMRGYKTTKTVVTRFDSSDYPLDSLIGIGSVVWYKNDTARSIPYLAREKWATITPQNTYGAGDPYTERPVVYDYTDNVISFFPIPTSEDSVKIYGWNKIPNITIVSQVAQIPQKYRVAVLKYATWLVARAKQHPQLGTFLDEYRESLVFLMNKVEDDKTDK